MSIFLFKMLQCKVLCIGDPHFKISNVTDTDLFTTRIIEIIQRETPDAIVCLGDILDRHESIHVTPLLNATKFLNLISTYPPLGLYILIGNHDRPNNSTFLTQEHPFTALKYWNNTWVADIMLMKNVKGFNFVFAPYVPPGKFKNALETILFLDKKEDDGTKRDIMDVDCIFAHQEFRKCKMGSIESEVGDPWPESYPLVISGHIHEYDELQKNLIYVGTPMQHAFGDRDDKTISIFTFTKTKKEEKINFEQKRVSLDLPRKRMMQLSVPELLNLKISDEELKKLHLKIVVEGDASQIKLAMKSSIVKNLAEKNVKIVYKAKMKEIGKEEKDKKDAMKQRTALFSFKERLLEEVIKSGDLKIKNIFDTLF